MHHLTHWTQHINPSASCNNRWCNRYSQSEEEDKEKVHFSPSALSFIWFTAESGHQALCVRACMCVRSKWRQGVSDCSQSKIRETWSCCSAGNTGRGLNPAAACLGCWAGVRMSSCAGRSSQVLHVDFNPLSVGLFCFSQMVTWFCG